MDNLKSARRRVVIIGLDGTPYSFLKKEIESGNLPNLKRLISTGNFMQMESEIPTISSVAWTSFMTGKNPAEHGIFGFTDRKPGTYELYFPNYSHIKAEPVWDRLSREGKRCCVINVPSTYPARPVNGVLVSGFVAPNLERAVYPVEAFDYLRSIDYRIDVDASLGRESLDLLIEDLHLTLEKRRETMMHFWEQEKWDFFMCVFTGTDRLHHFLWRQYEDNDSVYAREFMKFYRRLDEIVGEFAELVPDDDALFMLSDHGFCSLDKEIYLNNLLVEKGFLSLAGDKPRTIADIDPVGTRAYCMDPGRLYVNLEGREPGGIVGSSEYAAVIEELRQAISTLEDPENGTRVIDAIYSRDELFSGPHLSAAPDLVAMPVDGYDIKGFMDRTNNFGKSHLTGMHTQKDAFFLARLEEAPAVTHIRQVAETICGS